MKEATVEKAPFRQPIILTEKPYRFEVNRVELRGDMKRLLNYYLEWLQ